MKITGMDQARAIFREIAPREVRNLGRATVLGIARRLAVDASDRAPESEGDLKGSIKAKRERGSKTVLAASTAVSRTAFYWRYLEYGQGPDSVEHAFFLKSVKAFEPDLERVFLDAFGDALEKRLLRLKRAAA